MQRNSGFIKAEEHDKDVSAAFTMGFWTGSGVSTFGCIIIVGATLFYLGAFH